MAYPEGSVLFDLPGLASKLPRNLTVEALASQTTGMIAARIRQSVPAVFDPQVKAWLVEAARCLRRARDISAQGPLPSTFRLYTRLISTRC